MRRVNKVVGYVVHENQLLVFRHVDFPDAGIQVIAGTIEPGEAPEVAVLRETWEESGLENVSIVRFLGTEEFSMVPYREEIQTRHFFQLAIATLVPTTWRHEERHASTGEPPIALEFFWMDLRAAADVLAVGQGALLVDLSTGYA